MITDGSYGFKKRSEIVEVVIRQYSWVRLIIQLYHGQILFNGYKLSSSSGGSSGAFLHSFLFIRQFTTKRFTWLLLPRGVFSLLPPAMKDAHVLLSNVRIEHLVTAQRMFLCPNPICCWLEERLEASRLGQYVTRDHPLPLDCILTKKNNIKVPFYVLPLLPFFGLPPPVSWPLQSRGPLLALLAAVPLLAAIFLLPPLSFVLPLPQPDQNNNWYQSCK